MDRRPLYSRSGSSRAEDGSQVARHDNPADAPFWSPPLRSLRHAMVASGTGLHLRPHVFVLVASGAIAMLALIGLYDAVRPVSQEISPSGLQTAVDDAIHHMPRAPATTSLAYAKIIPSVVRVDGYIPKRDPLAGAGEAFPSNNAVQEDAPIAPGDKPVVEGTGVVISDDGTILTSLHVVALARKLRVTFADGTESDADVDSTEPENDLAILKPDGIPSGLQPAIIASAEDLRPGDQVMAVGFPFGIGPSASAGVVSGLRREFGESGQAKLTDLIQFDAAANPGNSGGPLVDSDGDVVGIVAAILNPSGAETFAGVGFAVPIDNAAKGVMGDSPL